MQKFGESLAARKAGQPVADDGYLGQYIEDWATEMPDGVDPVVWGEERALANHARHSARSTCTSTSGSAS